jgi:hypothetical protein
VEWYVAIDGVQSGPFSRVEVAKRIVAAGPDKTVLVWKQGMSGWKPPSEVSVVERELSLVRPAWLSAPREPPAFRPPPPAHVASVGKPVAAPATATPPPSQLASGVRSFVGTPGVPGFASEVDHDLFGDHTTKKTQNLHDLEGGAHGGSFAEVTTKKGKNLRGLEAESLYTPEPAFSEDDKTPPPVQPLPPVGAKVTAPVAAAPSAPVPPFVARVPPFVAPVPPPAAPAVPFTATPPPFVVPAAPFAAAPSAAVAPFGVPAAPGGPQLSAGDLPTPPPTYAAPFDGAMSPPFSPEFRLTGGGLAGLFRRQPGLKYVVAAVAIVGLVILLGLVILRSEADKGSEPEPATPAVAEPPKVEEPKPTPVEKPVPPVPSPPAEEKSAQVASPRSGGRHGGRSVHEARPKPERPAKERDSNKPPRLAGARPNPFDDAKNVSQSQITAVVRNTANQAALKSCYERALKMDNHLTSGRIDVTVSISPSGAVQRVVVNAPSSFILVEPCIKNAVKRWVFPPNIEEYGTNFPLIMQGGM